MPQAEKQNLNPFLLSWQGKTWFWPWNQARQPPLTEKDHSLYWRSRCGCCAFGTSREWKGVFPLRLTILQGWQKHLHSTKPIWPHQRISSSTHTHHVVCFRMQNVDAVFHSGFLLLVTCNLELLLKTFTLDHHTDPWYRNAASLSTLQHSLNRACNILQVHFEPPQIPQIFGDSIVDSLEPFGNYWDTLGPS